MLAAERLAGGRRLVGRKIGLTSAAVQTQFGVHQPDFGVLTDDMQVADGSTIDLAHLLAPRIEAEVAFKLATDLDAADPNEHAVADATDWVAPAIEVVDSRIRGWDISITDTIADNASSGMFVVGRDRHHIDEVELTDVAVRIVRLADGEMLSSGVGAACLGSPLTAATWLAREMQRRSEPLRAGDLVLSGALGPMVDVSEAASYQAEFGSFGSVSITFERSTPS